MRPNEATAVMQPIEDSDHHGCNFTGASCFLVVNITTANTIRSEETGAYLEVRLPPDLTIFSDMCWAMITATQQLNCQIVEENLL